MKQIVLTGFFVTAISVSSSLAGVDELKACSENLSPQAQKIMLAVAPKLKPDIDMREVMRSTVISLVRAGDIERSEARSNAREAGRCLEKLRD